MVDFLTLNEVFPNIHFGDEVGWPHGLKLGDVSRSIGEKFVFFFINLPPDSQKRDRILKEKLLKNLF
jgi:hypothetical protein